MVHVQASGSPLLRAEMQRSSLLAYMTLDWPTHHASHNENIPDTT